MSKSKSGADVPKDEQGSPDPDADAQNQGAVAVQRSGSGAETALLAMVQRRQMRASRDEPAPPDGALKKTEDK